MKQRAEWKVTIVVALATFSCHDSCPSGYIFYENTCVIQNSAGRGNAGGAVGKSGGAAGQSGGVAGSSPVTCASAFGRVCLSAADCDCDTDYCAGYPGQQGICTHTGCLNDAGVCPAQWTCMDLSTIQPGLPSICTPPE